MHLTRSTAGLHFPIPRKGTKYLARAASHVNKGIPVVIAVRDILGLARTSKEVKQMVNQGLLKINGRKVNDIRESVRLMNILEADKPYTLKVLPTGRYTFEEEKNNVRTCKVVGKKMLRGKKLQIHLHDGTSLLTKEKVAINDSVHLDLENKVKKVLAYEKGKTGLVVSGSKVGRKGKITTIENGKTTLTMEGGDVTLDTKHIVVVA